MVAEETRLGLYLRVMESFIVSSIWYRLPFVS